MLVFLNNDTGIMNPDWLKEMVSLTLKPDVGCVGAKLFYGNDTIQHAGVALGIGNFDGSAGIAGHYGMGAHNSDLGYFGAYALTREVTSVTAACLAVRKEVFEAVGGLDEENLPVAFNDIDLCLRIREKGWRNIWTPFAELYHLESFSRGSDLAPDKIARFNRECCYMRQRWGKILDTDPFYHRVFDRKNTSFQLIQAALPKAWEIV